MLVDVMRRIIIILLVACSLLAGISASTAAPDDWWSEDYNYRIPLSPSSGSEPGMATISFSDVVEQLGLMPIDSRYHMPGGIDPLSLHAVSVDSGEEIPFSWAPVQQYLLADFEDGLPSWTYGSDIWAMPSSDAGSTISMAFSRNTNAGVKIYTVVSSDNVGAMSYLSFMGKGAFRITIRDPAKGVFLVDETVSSSSFERHVLPLDFTEFRDGISYYLEVYPLDDYTISWIDDVLLMGDDVTVYLSPSPGDVDLYFNTYLTGSTGPQDADYAHGNSSAEATAGAAEGFRVLFNSVPTGPLVGNYDVSVSVEDARNDIEWVRYRIDWPSLMPFDQWEYGVWGDLAITQGTTWSAAWDTLRTVCDGHHDLAVMARDTAGNEVVAVIPLEVDNISSGTVIEPDATTFSFAMIGDMQPVAGGGIYNPHVASYIMDAVAGEDIDFIVQVGDLAYAGHEVEYLQVRDQLTAYARVPFYAAPGNHDTAASEGLDLFRYYFGDAYYAFEYGNAYFIFLCTELPGEKGYITGDQLAWLDSELATHADKDHIIISAHQPLYPVYHGIINQDEVHAVIERYSNVSAIFQGHEHTYSHEVIAGMDVFVTGGATWLDGQYEAENTFNHYFVFTIDGESLTWEVVTTSHMNISSPAAGYVTTGETLVVEGTTQPYSTVTVNGESTQSTDRGDFSVTIPLPMGQSTILASADFPLGGGASVEQTVTRIGMLSLAGPESVTVGDPLVLTVTDSLGNAVTGATVDLYGERYETSSTGLVEITEYPEGALRISAYHDSYQGTYLFVEAKGASGGVGVPLMAGLAIVVIIALAAIVLKRK